MVGSDYLPGPDADLGDDGPRPASVDLPPSHTATVVYDEPGLPDLLAIRIDAPDEPPDAPEDRGSVAFPLGVAMIVTGLGLLFLGGAAAVVLGIYWATSQGTAVAPSDPEITAPVTAPLDPVDPVDPKPTAAPPPAPPKPAAAAPAPAPAVPAKPVPGAKPVPSAPVPTAAPVPVPVIVIPDPAPAAAPAPEPAAEPAPAPEPVATDVPAPPEPTPDTPARLVVAGDVLVELEGDYGGFREGTPLPPGAYSVRADFGAGLVDTGLRTIATPGGTVSVKCADGACTVSP